MFVYVLPVLLLAAFQVFLSRRPRKWPGLILPILFLAVALLLFLAIVILAPGSEYNLMESYDEHGNPIHGFDMVQMTHSEAWLIAAIVFAVIGGPGAIYLVIYFVVRKWFPNCQ